jgi:outer membrane protein assembly factor BamB
MRAARPSCWTGMTLALLVVPLCPGGGRGDDWPGWLGPKGDGVWREDGIVEKFPRGGPPVKWRVKIGPGYSGPAVAAGRVYVMDREAEKQPNPRPGQPAGRRGIPGKERVLCLDADSGERLWKHEYDCTYKVAVPTGPRTTPVVRDGKVYTLGAMGDLLCLDARKGTVLWSKNFVKDCKAPVPVWGWSATPLVDDRRVYCLVGGKGSAAVAFDKDKGTEVWKAVTAEEVGYAPPALIEAGGKKQLVVWPVEKVCSLNPETGEEYWSKPYPAEGPPQRPGVSIATPRQVGDLLFVTSFYHGAMAFKLAKDRPGAELLWKAKSDNPQKPDTLNGCMTTPLVKGGHVYGICGFGELRCLEVKTGKQVWQTYDALDGKKGFLGTAFLVEHKDRCFLFNDQGDLVIARLTPKGYKEIDRAHILDTSQEQRGRKVVWCYPAFAGRCMFVRNDKELVCVSLAEKS